MSSYTELSLGFWVFVLLIVYFRFPLWHCCLCSSVIKICSSSFISCFYQVRGSSVAYYNMLWMCVCVCVCNLVRLLLCRSELMDLFIYLLFNCQRQGACSLNLLSSIRGPIGPVSSRCNVFLCRSVLVPGGGNGVPLLKSAALVLTR